MQPHGPDPGEDPERQPLVTERLRRLATPVAIVLAGLLVVTLGYQGPMWGAVLIVVAVIVIVLALRRRGDGDDEYGPGAG